MNALLKSSAAGWAPGPHRRCLYCRCNPLKDKEGPQRGRTSRNHLAGRCGEGCHPACLFIRRRVALVMNRGEAPRQRLVTSEMRLDPFHRDLPAD